MSLCIVCYLYAMCVAISSQQGELRMILAIMSLLIQVVAVDGMMFKFRRVPFIMMRKLPLSTTTRNIPQFITMQLVTMRK